MALSFAALGLGACGSSDETAAAAPAGPFPEGQTTVVGAGPDAGKTYQTPIGAACITTTDGTCVKPQDTCGEGATADVVTDAKGKVVSVLCYSSAAQKDQVVVVPDAAEPSAKVDNNQALVLDGKDDGADITGDVTVSGNNAIIYGQGPGVSVIGGNVTIAKNNGTVRGVRIKGNVTIDGNNASLVLCVIEGDLTITSNNNAVVQCNVFGNITVTGNNDILVSDGIGGTASITGQNALCESDFAFVDANQDGTVADNEVGAALVCGAGSAPVSKK